MTSRRRRLGQYFLEPGRTAGRIVDAAGITTRDTVLEVGTGRGVLTAPLCRRAARVVSVEYDEQLYLDAARSMGHIENLTILHGDGFGLDAEFDVFVSNLPYYKSRAAIEWLAARDFSRAVLMVQSEFADKLSAAPRSRRAVAVLAGYAFEISEVCRVGRGEFDRPPNVDSTVLRLVKRNTVPADVIRAVNRMYSYRRKTIQNILGQFGASCDDQRRLEELSAEEIVRIARRIA